MTRRIVWLVALAAILVPNSSVLAQGPHAGTELTAFVVADRFAGALQALAPRFEEETGIRLNIVPQGYPELYQRAIADFVGGTAEGDLYSVDIMWSGEWAQAGHMVDLAPLIEQHADELDVDDIMPVTWNLGGWGAQQIAFPLAGYAGVLSYNRDVLEAEGVAVPTTTAEWQEVAAALTGDGRHGIVMNGARGAPVAQDWMYYMLAHGGRLLDADGRPRVSCIREYCGMRGRKSPSPVSNDSSTFSNQGNSARISGSVSVLRRMGSPPRRTNSLRISGWASHMMNDHAAS
jgi:multiple sugar transport system substrate-binding protein